MASMSLKVEVISAENVPNLETFGESDPYTTVTYLGMYIVFFLHESLCISVQ